MNIKQLEQIATRIDIIRDQCDELEKLLGDLDLFKDILKEVVDIRLVVDFLAKQKKEKKKK